MEDEVATVQSTGQPLESTSEVKRKIQTWRFSVPPQCKEIVILSMPPQQAEEYAAVVEQACEEHQNAYAATSRLAVVLQKC